jgi:hypothetical protein
MAFTEEVLVEVRDRLGTLQSSLALEPEATEFAEATLRSIQRVLEMSGFEGPIQWPDVPPRESSPGEVLLPLESRLVEDLAAEAYLPTVSDQVLADVQGEEAGAAVEALSADVERRLEDLGRAKQRVAAGVLDVVRGAFGAPAPLDDERALATADALRDAPGGAAATLEPERVLALVL